MSEHKEQCEVIKWARGSGLRKGAVLKWPCLKWLYSIPNGAFMRNRNIAIKMKREGMTNGISDLCLPFPSKGYHGLYIELKWKNNKPTKDQKEFLEYAKSVDYMTAICYNSESAIKVIEGYLS